MSIISMIQNKDYTNLKTLVEDKLAKVIAGKIQAKKTMFLEKIRSEKK